MQSLLFLDYTLKTGSDSSPVLSDGVFGPHNQREEVFFTLKTREGLWLRP
jgi:hypothetical protein